MMSEQKAPVKTYFKWEFAELYGVSMDQLDTWNKLYEDDLKRLDYKPTQKRYTIAQVELLFNKLGRP
jgi:hypothetical protein